MEQWKLGEMEKRLAELIWEHAPIASGQLAKLCGEEFGWKRTTTYTMLKRLCDRGFFANESGTVVVRMAREEFGVTQGERVLEEHFEGSLPRFLAAFSRRRRLSAGEVEELRRLIENFEEESDGEHGAHFH